MTRTRDSAFYEDPTNSIGYLCRITFRGFARALEKRTLPKGVSIGQWRFLRVLWVEDGMTQRELSRRVGMREPTTVVALKSLEKSGLVKRVQSTEDRRRVHVFLTPKAKRLKTTLLPTVADIHQIAIAGISDDDLAIVRRVLLSVADNLAAEEVFAQMAEDEP